MSVARPARENWLRYLLWFVALALLIYLLWRIRLLLITLLLAIVLAYALRPLVALVRRVRFRRYRLSPYAATFVVFVAVIAALWLLGMLMVPPIRAEIERFQARWPTHRENLQAAWKSAQQWYRSVVPEEMQRQLADRLDELQTGFTKALERGVLATFHGLGFLVELFLVPILAFYFLSDTGAIRQQFLFFLPRRYLPGVTRALTGLDDIMARYIRGQIILCAVAFVVVTLGLYIVGIRYYLSLGVVAGLTRAIPVIGPIVGAIPLAIVVVLQSQSVAFGFWVIVGFSLLHLFESKWLMPQVLGLQLEIHPVLIIIALLLGYEFFGILGMFLAVPGLAAVRLLVRSYRERQAPPEEAARPTA
jgi:predicted PurR-regulated permease PerM